MITKSGLRMLKLVVPTHVDLLPSSGYFLISFAKAFTWRLYDLLVAAYLLEEQEAMIKMKTKKRYFLKRIFFRVKIKLKILKNFLNVHLPLPFFEKLR
jgi:hypothetical protein